MQRASGEDSTRRAGVLSMAHAVGSCVWGGGVGGVGTNVPERPRPDSTRPGAARHHASRAPRPSCARRAPSGPPRGRASRSCRWRRPTTARRSRPTRRRGHTELSDHLPITIILCVDSTCLVPPAPDETSARPAPARLSEAAAQPIRVSLVCRLLLLTFLARPYGPQNPKLNSIELFERGS